MEEETNMHVPSTAAMLVAGVIISLMILTFGITIIHSDQKDGSSYVQSIEQVNEKIAQINKYESYNAKEIPGYEVANCICLLGNNVTASVDGTIYHRPASKEDVDALYQKTSATYIDPTATYICYVHYAVNGSLSSFTFSKQS